MNREIKFRGWHKKLKWAWNVGIDKDGLALVQWNEGSQEDMSELGLKEWSLSQFTGLLDAKGKEIWEGDIVESTSELILIERNTPTGKMMTQRYSIEYQIDKAMFGRRNIPSGRLEPWSMTQEQMTEYYIVIGNIYSNPELMEGK